VADVLPDRRAANPRELSSAGIAVSQRRVASLTLLAQSIGVAIVFQRVAAVVLRPPSLLFRS